MHVNGVDLDTVRINKAKLIEVIEYNKANHLKEYKEAKEGYAEEFTRQLNEKLEMLNEGEIPSVYFENLPKPESHVGEYETALSMLSYSVDEEIELSADAFRNYVLDDWGWKHSFSTTLSNYKK